MTLSTELADIRAAFRRELRRLAARPIEGGPQDAAREGSLLAWFPPLGRSYVVDNETVERLRALPSCAGVEAVRESLRAGDVETADQDSPLTSGRAGCLFPEVMG